MRALNRILEEGERHRRRMDRRMLRFKIFCVVIVVVWFAFLAWLATS